MTAQLDRLAVMLDDVDLDADALPAERAVVRALANEWSSRSGGAFDPDSPVDMATLTRGWILDQAIDRVMQLRPGINSITVAAGPDAVHAGSGAATVTVGPEDTAPPSSRVRLAGAAAITATSQAGSATVVSHDAASAAALACSLLRVGAQDVASRIPDASDPAWMTIGADGQVETSAAWSELAV